MKNPSQIDTVSWEPRIKCNHCDSVNLIFKIYHKATVDIFTCNESPPDWKESQCVFTKGYIDKKEDVGLFKVDASNTPSSFHLHGHGGIEISIDMMPVPIDTGQYRVPPRG